MPDINALLSKHFAGETTPQEDQLVKKYKTENPEHYKTLKAFWTKKGLKHETFDTTKAWNKIEQKATRPKVVPIYRYLKVAASVAAIFLMVFLSYYFNNSDQPTTELAVITAKVNNEKVELEDGSVVYLNSNSALTFPKNFTSKERIVTLHGEAFFDVARDVERPFIIHTIHSDIEVLGTSFNINTTTQETEISVANGKVKVQSTSNDKSAILTPDQSAKVTKENLEVYAAHNQNYLAWQTGIFHFDKTPISQVVEKLNTFYKDKIILTNQNSDCLFTANLNQQELLEVIEIIQLSCSLELNKKNNSYELY